ncbi:hypothetical protein EPR50_G00066420 [Perca flavescens]|uniref:Uncharacterized protein n=1 Tax=Perca flavescens TaxID=8167 RepID=A0A484DA11_PERFV|nr:hypothetical protein EPR50_G00066420 [Perca flavescens]
MSAESINFKLLPLQQLHQCNTPPKPQRNMDKDRKMRIFYLFLTAIISPVFTEEWRASVVKELDALVTSCVVVPCSFSHPNEKLPTSRLRGIWHRSTDKNPMHLLRG